MKRAAALIRAARAVVVFTGAGVSAESGVPTYRGQEDGLWSKHNLDRYANPRGYAKHLDDAYAWYRARAQSLARVEPNAAHHAIARLADRVPKLTVVTQNIDSLHQRAGSRDVIELHGNLREFRCDGCGWRAAWDHVPESLESGGSVIIVNPDIANQPIHRNVIAVRRTAADALPTLVDLTVGFDTG